MLDFIKTEVEILNSLGAKSGIRDKDLEKALVNIDLLRITYRLLCTELQLQVDQT